MDTVREESSSSLSSPTIPLTNEPFQYPTVTISGADDDDQFGAKPSRSTSISSRRPSLILAALRRPSQALALSAAHAIMKQKKQLLNYVQNTTEKTPTIVKTEKKESDDKSDKTITNDTLATILSALYAKTLVVLGIAFPITEIISKDVKPFFYQGFYLYLYLGSIGFVAYMYTGLVRSKVLYSFGNDKTLTPNGEINKLEYYAGYQNEQERIVRYGSFYLRLGAIAFGIGSMVYSGLEFGQYFEFKPSKECYSTVLQAITPAMRMILTIIQIQFIFLNSKDIDTTQNKIVTKFGLMHMIATNLCEWLYVIVEETEHEITHLAERDQNITQSAHCQKTNVMGSLVTKASPFLFPCTIEYSLICAVILLEMWKKVKTIQAEKNEDKQEVKETRVLFVSQQEKITNVYKFQPRPPYESAHHFTVDCSSSHKGLFAGILVIVLTIISLTMFFVLRAEKGTAQEEKYFKAKAQLEVNIYELTIHVLSTLAVLMAMYKFRSLKHDKKTLDKKSGMSLDNTLLVVAQTGMFIYCVFSIIGSYFTNTSYRNPAGLSAEVFSIVQTCLQTIFALDAWSKRCQDAEQVKRKPGRELITFLIIANMALWSINCLEKNRAEFRTNHLNFYGPWAWTIITHISMPLAIFYRFHSTICLFEIWKSTYKNKYPYNSQLYGYM